MEKPKYKTALIVGAGEGLSASLARVFAREGIRVALAARQIEKLGALCSETGARAFACNATEPDEVERLFGLVEREIGVPDVVVYNASGRARGAFADLVPADVAQAVAISAFGGFLVAQQAVKRMLPNKHGAILFWRPRVAWPACAADNTQPRKKPWKSQSTRRLSLSAPARA